MLASDLKTGKVFKEGGAPFVVLKYTHTKTARGGATVRVKGKNLITGQVLEKGYDSGNKVEDADVTRKTAQYLYKDNGYVFMDPVTYDQFTLTQDMLEDQAKYLKEGENVTILYFEDKPISIDLPNTVVFEITYTEPGYRGNTQTNVLKEATAENGTIVRVPIFIKVGDRVKINTQTGEYMSKA